MEIASTSDRILSQARLEKTYLESRDIILAIIFGTAIGLGVGLAIDLNNSSPLMISFLFSLMAYGNYLNIEYQEEFEKFEKARKSLGLT